MKRFLVLVLVAIGVGVMVLIYTGKSVDDIIPVSFIQRLLPSRPARDDAEPSGPPVRKFSLADKETGEPTPGVIGDIPRPVDDGEPKPDATGTQVAMVDVPGGVGKSVPVNPDEEAAHLIREARKLLKEGKTGEAGVKLKRIPGLRCRDEYKREAEKLTNKGIPLFDRVFSMEAEPMEGVKTFKLGSGGDIHGWIAKEDARSVTVKMEDGGVVVLQRDGIDKIVGLSSTERRANVTVEYLSKKDKLGEDDALGQYDLAEFCRKKGLNKEAGQHLETAFDLNSEVQKFVRNREAKSLYLLAVYFGSLGKRGKEKEYEAKLKAGYPESQYLAMLGEEVKMLEPEPSVGTRKNSGGSGVPVAKGPPPKTGTSSSGTTTSRKSSGPMPTMGGSSGQHEAQGNKHYQEGLRLYRQSLPLLKSGSRSFDGVNKRAMSAFQKAVDCYRRAKQSGQAGSNIDAKMAQANSLKYGCYKMARVR